MSGSPRLAPVEVMLQILGNEVQTGRTAIHDTSKSWSVTFTETGDREQFAKAIFYQSFDMSQTDEYKILKTRIDTIDEQIKIGGNYLYYLATPPEFFQVISNSLKKQQLHENSNRGRWKRPAC